MTVYISGPITGDERYKEKFAAAEKELAAQGHRVLNPAKLGDVLPELEYEQYLHIDFALLDICGAIYMLRGYESSRGAIRELARAKERVLAV